MCQVRRLLFDQMDSEASRPDWQASSYHDNDNYYDRIILMILMINDDNNRD